MEIKLTKEQLVHAVNIAKLLELANFGGANLSKKDMQAFTIANIWFDGEIKRLLDEHKNGPKQKEAQAMAAIASGKTVAEQPKKPSKAKKSTKKKKKSTKRRK